jgi:hypothetical protein
VEGAGRASGWVGERYRERAHPVRGRNALGVHRCNAPGVQVRGREGGGGDSAGRSSEW